MIRGVMINRGSTLLGLIITMILLKAHHSGTDPGFSERLRGLNIEVDPGRSHMVFFPITPDLAYLSSGVARPGPVPYHQLPRPYHHQVSKTHVILR